MKRPGMTVREAAKELVRDFDRIPQSVVKKLMIASDYNDIVEITPPGENDYVYVLQGVRDGEYGYIVESGVGEYEDGYRIELDGSGDEIVLEKSDFEVQRDDGLPMWGTMWTFGDSCDDYWLEKMDGLQKMADCGFRVYESEDYGYIFGIDGAGYDFYESHWIPLYKARDLQWHDEAAEHERVMKNKGYHIAVLGTQHVWVDKNNTVVEVVEQ